MAEKIPEIEEIEAILEDADVDFETIDEITAILEKLVARLDPAEARKMEVAGNLERMLVCRQIDLESAKKILESPDFQEN